MKAASAKLHEMGAAAVVITGGHLDKAIDLLSFTTKHGIEQEVFKAERQRSNSTHGTGCAFATAMACHLALGPRIGRSRLAGKDLRHRRDLERTATGPRNRAGSPSLPHEPAETGGRFGTES